MSCYRFYVVSLMEARWWHSRDGVGWLVFPVFLLHTQEAQQDGGDHAAGVPTTSDPVDWLPRRKSKAAHSDNSHRWPRHPEHRNTHGWHIPLLLSSAPHKRQWQTVLLPCLSIYTLIVLNTLNSSPVATRLPCTCGCQCTSFTFLR